MNQFTAFLKIGFDYITNIHRFDHMLLIIILCAVYKITEWRKVTILVTAFTIGHSITLALFAHKIVIPNSEIIEILIPVTILGACISNLYYKNLNTKGLEGLDYFLALVIGLIHGIGFSTFFNNEIGDGMDISLPLVAFNLGLEVGQLLIIANFFAFYFIIKNIWNIRQRSWTVFLSGVGAGVAIIMILDRL